MPLLAAAVVAAVVAVNEAYFAGRRVAVRDKAWALATDRARFLGRPLIVVGAPDGGPTMGPGCGDITLDINPSACPRAIQCDISKPIPLPDACGVVLVTCVLELVDDYPAAMRELDRISGGNVFIVRVEPWTLTAYLYPGAKRTVAPHLCVEAPSGWRQFLPR
jgi:hypothetical protein